MRRISAIGIAIAALSLSACQLVRPFTHGHWPSPSVDVNLPSLDEWRTLPGARPIELAEPGWAALDTDPRVAELERQVDPSDDGEDAEVAR